jgi:hypothetical protein
LLDLYAHLQLEKTQDEELAARVPLQVTKQ